MVKSGLIDEPAVSHYRLTAHLSLALVIMGFAFWFALDILRPQSVQTPKSIKILTHVTMSLLVIQILLGGLVAGLKAGFIFNTWPLMGENFIPTGLLDYEPSYKAFIDSAITTQFEHRMGAYLLLVMIGLLFWKSFGQECSGALRKAIHLVVGIFITQVIIGIIMLINDVPVGLGTLHQGGGAVCLLVLINLMHLQKKLKNNLSSN